MVRARLQQRAITQPFTVKGGLVRGAKTSYPRFGGLWYHRMLNTLTKKPPQPFPNRLG
ncbi:hypothetical protein M405DRAFT_811001, partial [Rhizopogon salebrosus TDB-379]